MARDKKVILAARKRYLNATTAWNITSDCHRWSAWKRKHLDLMGRVSLTSEEEEQEGGWAMWAIIPFVNHFPKRANRVEAHTIRSLVVVLYILVYQALSLTWHSNSPRPARKMNYCYWLRRSAWLELIINGFTAFYRLAHYQGNSCR